eukprot:TRINITY_DN90606_c0_g1_i1.p1 TRINITY_DN90606_c0_g1~~TRINITY_DN90606_c0_g1_i1.p1  ORF type:complete len:287 (+),score=50.36 TRINITY_DN90606_c0_g1_i1:65-925(+)
MSDMDDMTIEPSELSQDMLVGSGVTAQVYKGYYRGHMVAIKELAVKSNDVDQAFSREVQVMRKVTHPNLVTMYGICVTQDENLKIVTEFCEGGAVFEFLHNCTEVEITHKQQAKMCLDVALAMRCLHDFKPMIIHRDLKSLNLLMVNSIQSIRDPVNIKVCDFGVAKLMYADNWGQQTQQAGTKHWMAPEMWRGTSYNEKVDVFSFAMVMFEVLCREVPFEDEEPADVGKYTLNGVRPDLDAVPPDCPEGLKKVMESCWEQEAEDRPAFTEVVPLLEEIYREIPVE